MADHEVQTIKFGTLRDIQDKNVLLLVETDSGIQVHQWTPNSVMPVTEYDTNHGAAARALQLLKTGPVEPQTHPEVAEIGSVETGDG